MAAIGGWRVIATGLLFGSHYCGHKKTRISGLVFLISL